VCPRLYSVVPVVTRLTVADDVLGGYEVPAGSTIIISLQGVHQNPQVWKEPTKVCATIIIRLQGGH
jgi:cytochrome P450